MLTPPHRRTADRWARHALGCGCRFAVAGKAAACLAFCERAGTRSFVVVSALVDVRAHARAVHQLAAVPGWSVPLVLSLCVVGEHTPAVVVSLPGVGPLGHLRPKHTAWAAPLVGRGLSCFALGVTGGTDDAPTRGVSIVLAGLDRALAALPRVAPYSTAPALTPRASRLAFTSA